MQEILMIAEPFHQSVEYFRRGMHIVAHLRNRIAERKAGYAWSYNVERGRTFATVLRCNLWCAECVDDLRHRDEALWPPVDEQQRDRCHVLGSLMYEV